MRPLQISKYYHQNKTRFHIQFWGECAAGAEVPNGSEFKSGKIMAVVLEQGAQVAVCQLLQATPFVRAARTNSVESECVVFNLVWCSKTSESDWLI